MREIRRFHIKLNGRVQGVGFRAFVQKNARVLGLTGWVRNVGYNQIETVAEGNTEILLRFVEILRAGPPSSHVETIEFDEEPVSNEFDRFTMRFI